MIADAAVSVLVIVGLVLARLFGWLWTDPIAGIVGAWVIASWASGLVRDTGAILLDMVPDQKVATGSGRRSNKMATAWPIYTSGDSGRGISAQSSRW